MKQGSGTSREPPVYLLCAKVHGMTRDGAVFSDELIGQYLDRRLNRIERATAAYLGRVVRRTAQALLASFDTAAAALRAGCEMQRRCAVMPQIEEISCLLQIGIHYEGVVINAETATETASRLTDVLVNGGVAASESVYQTLPSSLRDTSLQIVDAGGGLAAHIFDCQKIIHLPVSIEQAAPVLHEALPPAMPVLILRQKGRAFEFSTDHPTITIGRDPHSDIVINDEKASRKHCQIVLRPDGFVLVDLSTNGTFVSPNEGAALVLKRKMAPLSGSGYIDFGQLHKPGSSHALVFEVVSR